MRVQVLPDVLIGDEYCQVSSPQRTPDQLVANLIAVQSVSGRNTAGTKAGAYRDLGSKPYRIGVSCTAASNTSLATLV